MLSIPLRPVDAVAVTTLMDNSCDALLPDEGLVRRWGLAGTAGPLPVLPNGMALDGRGVDFLRAEHGFSALVEVVVDGRTRRVLFDAGISPDGLIGNLDRLAAEAPAVLVPAHCTSWAAQHALAAGLPDAFRPNVGSRFAL